MGTSLSGLTPATTFDGLLKTTDNEPIGATLKTISDGSGVDSVLQLSDSALQVNGAATINGAQMTIVGAGNDFTTNSFIIKNSEDFLTFRVRDDGQIFTQNLTAQSVSASLYALYGADYAPNIRVNIKGSGATSATTSLLVQNSAGTDMLKVTDDGKVLLGNSNVAVEGSSITRGSASITLGTSTVQTAFSSHSFNIFDGVGYTEAMRISGTDKFVGIGETTPTARLHVKGSGNTNTTTSLLVQNSDGTAALFVKDNGEFYLGGGVNTFSGSNNNLFLTGNNIYFKAGGNYAHNMTSAGLQLGNGAAAPTARLQVKGSGATSATTALLVQNSAGTDLLKVTDDGATEFGTGGGLKINFRTITGAANSNKSIEISDATTYSTRNGHIFKTYDGTAYIEAMRINGVTNPFVGIGESTPTARLQVKGSGNDATTTALLVQNSDGADLLKVTDTGVVTVDDRLIIGLDSVTDLNRIKTAALSIGSNIFYAASGTQVHIKGSGATSATTALLVQNSAGTDLFKVNDAGQATASGGMTAGYFSAGTSILGSAYARVRNTKLYPSQSGTGINIQAGATNNPPDASAVLQADSTTQGFLPPRMTTTERDAITTPAAGLMIYNTDTNTAECWNGAAWMPMF